MGLAIVLDEHTLGVICPQTNSLQVLRASVLRGAPCEGCVHTYDNLHFDPILKAGHYREATLQDFEEFGVVPNAAYFEEL